MPEIENKFEISPVPDIVSICIHSSGGEIRLDEEQNLLILHPGDARLEVKLVNRDYVYFGALRVDGVTHPQYLETEKDFSYRIIRNQVMQIDLCMMHMPTPKDRSRVQEHKQAFTVCFAL